MTATLAPAGQLTTADAFVQFIFGGNATFTLVSRKTGARYTYRVRVAKDNPRMFFVSTLIGSDNEHDYAYLGFIPKPMNPPRFSQLLKPGKKGNPADVRFKALAYVLERAWFDSLPQGVEVYHEGKCCRCGRKLTTPESVTSGIGPECAKKA